MQTERVRPVSFSDSLKNLPILLGSLVVAVGLVDLLLVIQPGLLVSLRGSWQEALPPGSGVSTLVAASVITGAIALAAMTLTWFVRSVRSAPYLTLAPLWVGLCMLVIGRMTVALPIPLPTPAFVAICALLFVGSGVLFETRSPQNNAVGAGLSALPILLLVLGYLLSDVAFDLSAMLLVLVLALAAVGAPVIAIACRANGAKLSGGLGRMQLDPGEQVVELLERARLAEDRATRAEQQLASSPAWAGGVTANAAPRIGDDDEFALSRRSGGGTRWLSWAVAGLAVAAIGGGYALAYAPLESEVEQLRVQTAKEAEALNFELTTLRAASAREKQALEEKLTAAYAAARTGGGSPEPGGSGSGSTSAALALGSGTGGGLGGDASSTRRSTAAEDDEDEDDSLSQSASTEERRAAREARRAAYAAAKEAKKQERLAAREAKRQARLAARAERLAARKAGTSSDDEADDDDEEAEEEREARAAEREAKKAEREAAREAKKAEREAAREAKKAAREADAEEEEEEAPKPAKPARSEPEESSDDPLEGLDGL